MRKGNNGGWLGENKEKPHEGSFMGVNLGSDYTAEHEWGVKRLQECLGIDKNSNLMGMERYHVGKVVEGVIAWMEESDEAALIIEEPSKWNKREKINDVSRELTLSSYSKTPDFAAAWDEKSLGIRVKGAKNIKKLKLVHEALLNNDAAVWLGGGGVFENAGLVIGIVSLIPKEMKATMKEAHEDRKRLEEASEKCGIKKKINGINEKFRKDNPRCLQTPLGYYALSPAWKTNGESKHPVMYWLNPQQQDKINYGWFTVEQLEEWIEGKGPIPKAIP
jgi:hypothetical protein